MAFKKNMESFNYHLTALLNINFIIEYRFITIGQKKIRHLFTNKKDRRIFTGLS